MSFSDPLPGIFAIQRRTNHIRVFFQILTTEYDRLVDCYSVSDYRLPGSIHYSLEKKTQPDYEDDIVNKVNIRHPFTDEIIEVNSWTLPFLIQNPGGPPIPVLEFQYRSWIPSSRSRNYLSIQMPYGSNDFLRTADAVQYKRLESIRLTEDKWDYARRVEDAIGTRGGGMMLQTRYRMNREREIHIETRTVERIVIKANTLPKAVGDILLASARKGEDTCPITSTPLANCEKLCVTSCFHIFDTESLLKWNETSSKCPVCRCKIENIVSEDKK